jgi:hypothetical protein
MRQGEPVKGRTGRIKLAGVLATALFATALLAGVSRANGGADRPVYFAASASAGELATALPKLASSYGGTAHNLTYGITSVLALEHVVEGGEGRISGQMVVEPPLYGSGPFTGTLHNGAIAFTVTPTGAPGGETAATFVGELSSRGALSGSYTVAADTAQSGTWELSPSSGAPSTAASSPIVGRSVTLTGVSGAVTFRLPGVDGFTRLEGPVTVPNGTDVDAIAGKVQVTVATSGAPLEEAAALYGGEFIVHQDSSAPYETHFVLSQPLTGCGASVARFDGGSAETASSKSSGARGKGTTNRHLWAQDSGGSFGTTGRYVSTTVEGTRWLTSDECAQSLVRVTQGVVAVRNLITHRTLVVHAGQRYTAARNRTAASGPLSAVDSYWAAIAAQDFTSAYGYLAPGAIGLTKSQFVGSERGYGVQSVQFRGRVTSVAGSHATVGVISLITHDRHFGCRTWSGSYDMSDRGSRWLIARADLTIRSCGR